jgi:hypothetical protein
MNWCLQSHDDSHWLCEALGFYVACPIKLELTLETNPIEVVCLFHKILEFVVLKIMQCCNNQYNIIFHYAQQNYKQFHQNIKDKIMIQLENT